MLRAFGHLIEGRMAVDLVGGRIEDGILLVRAGCHDVGGRHDPDRNTLLSTGVYVSGVAQRDRGIGRVHTADVRVRQPSAGSDEDLPQIAHAATSRVSPVRLLAYAA